LVLLGLDLAAQRARLDGGVAFKTDVMDDAACAFIDLEHHAGETLADGRRDVVADDHIRIALLLVQLRNLVLSGGEFDVIHGITHLDLDFLAQLVVVKSRVAQEADFANAATAGDLDNHSHAACHVHRADVQVFHRSGAVERTDVTLHPLVGERLACPGGHLAADAVFIEFHRTLEDDLHFLHDFFDRRSRRDDRLAPDLFRAGDHERESRCGKKSQT
jgi:hypothetical protein